MTKSGTPFRYRWSHRHPVHRALVRTVSQLLARLPFALKYGATGALRRRHLPYSLLGPGSVAVQVGAPIDTLLAGRSRAMGFVQRTAPSGRVLVVEPDQVSVEAFRRVAERQGFGHVDVVGAAAWSERTTITLEVDRSHPATNYTAGCADYSETDRRRFDHISVDAIPLDDLIDRFHLPRVDLVSVTTNGAEEAILLGLRRTIARDRPVICLARTADSYAELMGGLGYDAIGDDDRGFTFRFRDPGSL